MATVDWVLSERELVKAASHVAIDFIADYMISGFVYKMESWMHLERRAKPIQLSA